MAAAVVLLVFLFPPSRPLRVPPQRCPPTPSSTALFAKSLSLRQAIDHIKETVALSDIVGEYVEVKTGVGNVFKCLCPFHDDRNPSMTVSDDPGLYYCFACGAGGDVFNFVERQERCTFPEAVQHVVDIVGLDVVITNDRRDGADGGAGGAAAEQQAAMKRLEATLAVAAKYFTVQIMGARDSGAAAAKKHILARRIRPETAFKFQIGYAPLHPAYRQSPLPLSGPSESPPSDDPSTESHARSLTYNLTASGFDVTDLVASGLTIDNLAQTKVRPCTQSSYLDPDLSSPMPRSGQTYNKDPADLAKRYRFYDRFRGRLMVPIRNEHGVVVAFGGRVLDIYSDKGVAGASAGAVAAGGGEEINENDPTNLAKMVAAANEKARANAFPPPPAAAAAAASSAVAKYLNSPESVVFKKGSTLFGLDVARPTIAARKEAIVVEVRYCCACTVWVETARILG